MNDVKKISKADDTNKEEAASLVEYALLVALIAIVAIVAVRTLGQNASKKFSNIASAVLD